MSGTTGNRRRDEILAAAMELFSDKGYHSTSMRDIADRLGLQAGSLYVHIRSKEEVLFEIVDRAADRFAEAIERARAEAEARGADPEAALRLAVRNHLQVVSDNLDTATVFFHEWKFLDPDRRALILAKRDAYEAAFRDLIAQGIDAGVFRPVDPRLAGLAVLSMCNWFYQWYSPAGPLSAHEIADRFVDLLLGGLRADPGSPEPQGAATFHPAAGNGEGRLPGNGSGGPVRTGDDEGVPSNAGESRVREGIG